MNTDHARYVSSYVSPVSSSWQGETKTQRKNYCNTEGLYSPTCWQGRTNTKHWHIFYTDFIYNGHSSFVCHQSQLAEDWSQPCHWCSTGCLMWPLHLLCQTVILTTRWNDWKMSSMVFLITLKHHFMDLPILAVTFNTYNISQCWMDLISTSSFYILSIQL